MNYLAFDLGAESGRAILGILTKGRLKLEVLHRFTNQAVLLPDGLHWDILYQFSEMKSGLSLYRQKFGRELDGVSCDSWGCDFGLLDSADSLVSNPFHYRDHRTDGVMEKAFRKVPPYGIYQETGIQFMQVNTVYQLYSMVLSGSQLFSVSKTLLLMADLFHFFLSGEKAQEFTLATTTQLYNPVSGGWAKPLFENLNIPLGIMPGIVPPATVLGNLRKKVADEAGLPAIPVIAGANHDTAAAVAACPARKGERFAYLSSGTWSLLGVELPEPLISKPAMEAGFTNEGGVAKTIRFLHNITGLWILQQCRQKWLKESGEKVEYGTLVELAESAPSFLAIINPDDPSFLAPDDMEQAIVRFCQKTRQKAPKAKAEFVRIILESLALRYNQVLQNINRLFPDKEKVDVLYIMGGGSQNRLLNQFTADAVGLPVVAGPVEATAAGNVLAQALATGKLASLAEGRGIIRNSFSLTTYVPKDRDAWLEASDRMEKICKISAKEG